MGSVCGKCQIVPAVESSKLFGVETPYETVAIQFCPLHASAHAMKEALEELAVRDMDDGTVCFCADPCRQWHESVCEQARSALALANGNTGTTCDCGTATVIDARGEHAKGCKARGGGR